MSLKEAAEHGDTGRAREWMARAVHVEHGVRGLHDLVQRVLDAHLPEAEPAQLAEGGPHVLEFCAHGSTLARIFSDSGHPARANLFNTSHLSRLVPSRPRSPACVVRPS